MMSQISSTASPGQKARRQYINKFTQFFFRELDKGFTSPYVVLSTGTLLSFAGWKYFQRYVEPNRQINALWRQPRTRVPFSDTHNTFWGFGVSTAGSNPLCGGDPRSPMDIAADETEEAMRRPTLLHSEPSELQDGMVGGGGGMHASVACMELQEYDPMYGDDIAFRSVHYLYNTADRSNTDRKGKGTALGAEHVAHEDREGDSYLSRMPASGMSIIHGMVKCKSVTAQNNCVPYAGHLESEYARKMMLALGPVHMLRDIAKTSFPVRFTRVKESSVMTLVCGLHSGEMPRWLSTAFPNFRVDVVEPDGALVRICRRFMGFQESSNLQLFVADPIDFLRRNSHVDAPSGRRYDLVMLDAVDGAGHLSTKYGRLEFINNVRNCLSRSGCVVAALPNRDADFLYQVVQNWRLAFTDRTVLLVHCMTSPHTILITFQDDAERGRANFGTVANVDEFKDILRTKLSHYGVRRVPFDLVGEVSCENFRVLQPGRTYPMDVYLPKGHPHLLSRSRDRTAGRALKGDAWMAWLRRMGASWLTPTQLTDLRSMERRPPPV
uniref:Spermidine synthase n=1 Tax=Trypanosoma congolense (strain IL3000) TaxID=1068625 RepID=G0USF2_TRYCI|nr:conserved hypothetical protein [Trypanosoma congolense IL3000]